MPLTYEQLTQKHPVWSEMQAYWREIDLLYRGGRALKQQAATFLIKRPKEPAKIYEARLQQFLKVGIKFDLNEIIKERRERLASLTVVMNAPEPFPVIGPDMPIEEEQAA